MKEQGSKRDYSAALKNLLARAGRFCLIGIQAVWCLSLFEANVARAHEPHPFYVSICSIDHNAKTKALEITFKIFTEDLESALEDQTKERLRLGSEHESPKANRYILNYLKSHVTLQVDDDTLTFSYVGKEIEVEETWCYVEITNVPSVSKLTIRNSLLLEKFEAQQNLVHVKVGGKQKSLVLWKDKKEGSVEF